MDIVEHFLETELDILLSIKGGDCKNESEYYVYIY